MTYGGKSAARSHGTRGLSEGVPEHGEGGLGVTRDEASQLQNSFATDKRGDYGGRDVRIADDEVFCKNSERGNSGSRRGREVESSRLFGE